LQKALLSAIRLLAGKKGEGGETAEINPGVEKDTGRGMVEYSMKAIGAQKGGEEREKRGGRSGKVCSITAGRDVKCANIYL